MSRTILTNAFSFQMCVGTEGVIRWKRMTPDQVSSIEGIESVIGRENVAKVLSNDLKKEIKMNRANIELEDGDSLIIAQVIGGKLPEDATELPDGYKITYTKASLV